VLTAVQSITGCCVDTTAAPPGRRTRQNSATVAAPIFRRGNEVIAALSVLTPSADVDPVALTPAVTAVCRSISRAMRRD